MEIEKQAGALLSQAAGFVGTRTVAVGLDRGLFDAMATHGAPITPVDLAKECSLHEFYTEVWCRAAFAAGVLELAEDEAYQLGPHMETLLLDRDSPAYVGGLFKVMTQPEVFDFFSDRFSSVERIWWDQVGPNFIDGVGLTGGAFNNRLIPGALEAVPGAAERLAQGGRLLELACGTGVGLTRLAAHYPNLELVGLDGDAYSLERAKARLDEAGYAGRVEFVLSAMEDLEADGEFDVITINVSMHECRDIEVVTAAVLRALKPGGIFVNSDFPFPDSPQGLQTVPGRIMSGIQFFEAMIDDQLLPIQAYVDLFERHGFRDVGVVEVTPVHAVTHGRK